MGGHLLFLLGGAMLGLGVASLPSIGIFLLAGAVPTLLGAVLAGRGAGWPAGLVGASLPFFYVALLHRGGPGERCYETPTGGGCSELLDPRPWFVIGAVLLVLGVGLIILLRRRARALTRHHQRRTATRAVGSGGAETVCRIRRQGNGCVTPFMHMGLMHMGLMHLGLMHMGLMHIGPVSPVRVVRRSPRRGGR